MNVNIIQGRKEGGREGAGERKRERERTSGLH